MGERRERKGLKPPVFHILLCLADRDMHGLAIMEEVSERTQGDVHLWPGMLYGTLKQMNQDGLIEDAEAPADADPGGGKPRFYHITEEGRAALSADVARLSSYVATALAKNV